MKKKNLNELKLKKEVISKPVSGTIIGGGSVTCISSFQVECNWSLGTVDITNITIIEG